MKVGDKVKLRDNVYAHCAGPLDMSAGQSGRVESVIDDYALRVILDSDEEEFAYYFHNTEVEVI